MEDCRTIRSILDLFLKATALKINDKKSTLTTSGLSLEEGGRIEGLLHFDVKSLQDNFKYLGFHLKPDKYWIQDWKWLLVKIEKNLNNWGLKWLSRVGRLVFIKSALMSPY